ncbi:MAG TPA: replication factor C large subunit [archaeon]|nr:replication factor C large subunit [archaeon]
MSELWTEKYSPKNKDEFIGNSELVETAFAWAKNWENNVNQPPLLVWGQTGSGKTMLAYLLAKTFNWSVVELSSSDLRSKDSVETIVGNASQNASFSGFKRLVLLDDIDAMTRNDRGGVSAISSVIKDAKNPIIITATDIFSNKNVSPLRFVCKACEFKKINYLSMAKRLREILALEKISFDEEAVKELARNSDGDMRSALLDLQTLSDAGEISMENVSSLGSRERQQKVFSVMKAIFKGTNFNEVREMRIKSDLSPDMLLRWVEENIPRQYSDSNDIALAFDRLSRSDVFNGRIYRKQHWGFLRYSTELMGEGVALSKQKVSHDFVMYQFPGLLSMLSRTSGIRALKKSLGLKIGSYTHSSSGKVISKDLPFLRVIFKNKESAVALTSLFDLNEKEIALLLDTKPETKKVKTILEEAESLKGQRAKPKKLFGELLHDDSIVPDQLPERTSPDDEPEESDVKQTKLF